MAQPPDAHDQPLGQNECLLQVTRLLAQLNSQITAQPLPEPVSFVLGSGRSIVDFFLEFEKYAERTFGNDKTLWTPRLRQYLNNPVLSLYLSLTQVNQDYDSVKTALINAFGTVATVTTADLLEKFEKFEYDPNEGIRGFVSRLQVIASKTYAGAPEATINEIVKQKCLSSLPESLKTTLNFWLLSNPNATLNDLMRVGSGLEKSLLAEAAAVSVAPQKPMQNPPIPKPRGKFPTKKDNNPKPDTSKGPKVCQFCNKAGHDETTCFMKNRNCYRCGQNDHYISDCPVPSRSQTSRTPTQRRDVTLSQQGQSSGETASSNYVPLERNNPSPTRCMFCGSDSHMMMSCPHFEMYVDNMVQKRLNH